MVMPKPGYGEAAPARAESLHSVGAGQHHLVFVGGLHRSGTTLMADLLAAHPNVSGLQGTSVPENEGQHLQDVYLTARAHGGPGRFAFSAGAHLTEADAAEASDIGYRLLSAWMPYWDLSRVFLVEKSPPNVIMTRFLHAAFPDAAFVLIMRHPIAVAGATRKWSHTSYESLIRHWLAAYETMFEDISAVDRAIVVRYEDLVAEPSRVLAEVFGVVGLPPADAAAIAAKVRVVGGINDFYFKRWQRLWRTAPRRRIEVRYGERVRRLSYDLTDPEPLAVTW